MAKGREKRFGLLKPSVDGKIVFGFAPEFLCDRGKENEEGLLAMEQSGGAARPLGKYSDDFSVTPDMDRQVQPGMLVDDFFHSLLECHFGALLHR